MFEPLPGDLAAVLGTAAATAIGVLWRRCVVLEDRQQTNTEKQIEANNLATRALDALAREIERSR